MWTNHVEAERQDSQEKKSVLWERNAHLSTSVRGRRTRFMRSTLDEWNDTNCVTPITWKTQQRINLQIIQIQPLDDDFTRTAYPASSRYYIVIVSSDGSAQMPKLCCWLMSNHVQSVWVDFLPFRITTSFIVSARSSFRQSHRPAAFHQRPTTGTRTLFVAAG